MEQYLEQKFFAELVDISRSIVEFEAIEEWKNQQPVVKELTKELIKLICSSEGATDCTLAPNPDCLLQHVRSRIHTLEECLETTNKKPRSGGSYFQVNSSLALKSHLQ